MTKKTNNIFNAQYPSGIAFVGSILIWLGLGMLTHKVGAFTLIGIGMGFVLVAIISMLSRNRYLSRMSKDKQDIL